MKNFVLIWRTTGIGRLIFIIGLLMTYMPYLKLFEGAIPFQISLIRVNKMIGVIILTTQISKQIWFLALPRIEIVINSMFKATRKRWDHTSSAKKREISPH